MNDLALNRFKTVEIITTDGKRKRPASQPPSLPDISRASTTRSRTLSRIQIPNFIHRMLYKDMYWMLNFMLCLFFICFLCC